MISKESSDYLDVMERYWSGEVNLHQAAQEIKSIIDLPDEHINRLLLECDRDNVVQLEHFRDAV